MGPRIIMEVFAWCSRSTDEGNELGSPLKNDNLMPCHSWKMPSSVKLWLRIHLLRKAFLINDLKLQKSTENFKEFQRPRVIGFQPDFPLTGFRTGPSKIIHSILGSLTWEVTRSGIRVLPRSFPEPEKREGI